MSNHRFDAEAFYAALDATRRSRGLTWKQVANDAGITASTLTRMGQGRRPDVDSLAALTSWSGLDVNGFLRTNAEIESSPRPETLGSIMTLLRADKSLAPESTAALEAMISSAYEQMRKLHRAEDASEPEASERVQKRS